MIILKSNNQFDKISIMDFFFPYIYPMFQRTEILIKGEEIKCLFLIKIEITKMLFITKETGTKNLSSFRGEHQHTNTAHLNKKSS